jgi:hypothetical protein
VWACRISLLRVQPDHQPYTIEDAGICTYIGEEDEYLRVVTSALRGQNGISGGREPSAKQSACQYWSILITNPTRSVPIINHQQDVDDNTNHHRSNDTTTFPRTTHRNMEWVRGLVRPRSKPRERLRGSCGARTMNGGSALLALTCPLER